MCVCVQYVYVLCVCVWHFSNDKKDTSCAVQVGGDMEVVWKLTCGRVWAVGTRAVVETRRCVGAAGGHCAVEEVWGLVGERGLLLRSLPSVMHLPSGWQQAWSGVRWSEHGLSGAVT